MDEALHKQDHSRVSIRAQAEAVEGFGAFRRENPLAARIWCGICAWFDRLYEARETRNFGLAEECGSNISELASWSNPPSELSVDVDHAATIQLLLQAGASSSDVRSLTQPVKRPRGRPVSARYAAMLALQQRMLFPRSRETSWKGLTQRFCRCGSNVHDLNCQDRLRRQVKLLEAELVRLGV